MELSQSHGEAIAYGPDPDVCLLPEAKLARRSETQPAGVQTRGNDVPRENRISPGAEFPI